jgi:hypothetical protein
MPPPSFLENLPRFAIDALPVNQAASSRECRADSEIFRDGHPFNQSEILMDEGNWQRSMILREGLAIEANFSGGGGIDSSEDLDQSRFASAILSEQSDNFAGVEIERYGIDGALGTEDFGEVVELEERGSGGEIRAHNWGRQKMIALSETLARPLFNFFCSLALPY